MNTLGVESGEAGTAVGRVAVVYLASLAEFLLSGTFTSLGVDVTKCYPWVVISTVVAATLLLWWYNYTYGLYQEALTTPQTLERPKYLPLQTVSYHIISLYLFMYNYYLLIPYNEEFRLVRFITSSMPFYNSYLRTIHFDNTGTCSTVRIDGNSKPINHIIIST